jgi:hypothetical protein
MSDLRRPSGNSSSLHSLELCPPLAYSHSQQDPNLLALCIGQDGHFDKVKICHKTCLRLPVPTINIEWYMGGHASFCAKGMLPPLRFVVYKLATPLHWPKQQVGYRPGFDSVVVI